MQKYNILITDKALPEVNLTYHEWGNDKKVILCVHGLMCNSRYFDYLAKDLSSDFRVICIDMPGHGESSPLPKIMYNYYTFQKIISFFLNKLNINKLYWIGSSMGGIVAMHYIQHNPGIVKKLILNDIGPCINSRTIARLAKYMIIDRKFSCYNDIFDFMRNLLSSFGIKNHSHIEHLCKCSFTSDYRFHGDPAAASAFLKWKDGMEIWDIWNKINIPILILHGKESNVLLKSTARQMMQRPYKTDLIEYPGIGHMPSLMEYNQINDIRTWLHADT